MQLIEIIIQNLQPTVDKLKYMKKILIAIGFAFVLFTPSKQLFAWGKTGHELVEQQTVGDEFIHVLRRR